MIIWNESFSERKVITENVQNDAMKQTEVVQREIKYFRHAIVFNELAYLRDIVSSRHRILQTSMGESSQSIRDDIINSRSRSLLMKLVVVKRDQWVNTKKGKL